MDVAVKPASGQDAPLARDSLGSGANDDIDTGLRVGVARFADLLNTPVFEANIGLVDARIIHDQRIGDHRVHSPVGACDLALAHTVADDFAAAEFDLFAIHLRVGAGPARGGGPNRLGPEIAFDLDDQVGVGKAQLVPRGGAEHGGVIGAFDVCWHIRFS